MAEPWPDEVDKFQKNNRKFWRIITKLSKDVDDEPVPYTKVAELIDVDSIGWAKYLQKQGLVHVLCAKCATVGLQPWGTADDVGTDALPKNVTNPEDVDTKPLSLQNEKRTKNLPHGFTKQWKNTVDDMSCVLPLICAAW